LGVQFGSTGSRAKPAFDPGFAPQQAGALSRRPQAGEILACRVPQDPINDRRIFNASDDLDRAATFRASLGAGPVYKISARVSDQAWPIIEAIHAELEMLGIAMGGRSQARSGPDFMPMSIHGLAATDLSQAGTRYFDYHRTENDTLDKIDPAEMAQSVAAYAVLAWLAAQSPVDFGSVSGLIEPD